MILLVNESQKFIFLALFSADIYLTGATHYAIWYAALFNIKEEQIKTCRIILATPIPVRSKKRHWTTDISKILSGSSPLTLEHTWATGSQWGFDLIVISCLWLT